MKKNLTEIQRAFYERDEIIEFIASKEAKKFGKTASHIILPKELAGKIIDLNYLKLKEVKE